jgi:GTPase-associated adaptor domain
VPCAYEKRIEAGSLRSRYFTVNSLAFLVLSTETIASFFTTLRMTDVRIKFNGFSQRATIVFVDENTDLEFVNVWKDKLTPESTDRQRDAVDLVQLARDNYLAHSRVHQIYATSVEDIAQHINADPRNEVAFFVLMKCDWFPDTDVIGMCHFRRTWHNSIILDYLAAYPFATEKPKELKSVGASLLWFVSYIARQHNCVRIWGEATHGSHSYYEEAFKLEKVEDLILAQPENYKVCVAKDLQWRAEGNTMTSESVEKLIEAEAASPLLIGSRSLVVSPSKTLAYHFVELPSHTQRQIARVFGLPKEGDEGLRDDYLFRALFREAKTTGKLGDLWNEVETKHPKGRPEDNPFPLSVKEAKWKNI